MAKAKICNVETTEQIKDQVFRLARKEEFKSLANLFQSRYQAKNSLQRITGQAFNDGKAVGQAEDAMMAVTFLLDIMEEARKESDK